MSKREMVFQKTLGTGVDQEVTIPYEVLVEKALPILIEQRAYEVLENIVFDHEKQEIRLSIRPKDLHTKNQ